MISIHWSVLVALMSISAIIGMFTLALCVVAKREDQFTEYRKKPIEPAGRDPRVMKERQMVSSLMSGGSLQSDRFTGSPLERCKP